jgi:hypothetical protein
VNGWRVRGVVEGIILFPDAPEHEGHLGLVGGEDVQAQRRSFRSPTEAARWCERVLSGDLSPRWTAAGPLLDGHTPPQWNSAFVVLEDTYGNQEKRWSHTARG